MFSLKSTATPRTGKNSKGVTCGALLFSICSTENWDGIAKDYIHTGKGIALLKGKCNTTCSVTYGAFQILFTYICLLQRQICEN